MKNARLEGHLRRLLDDVDMVFDPQFLMLIIGNIGEEPLDMRLKC
jgi:hypothetical protein